MRTTFYSLIILLSMTNVFAKDYFVGGSNASDNNPGTSSQPFATIQKAASVAMAGDVITIRSGTYRETIVPTNSGASGNPITFQSERGAVAVISGNNRVTTPWALHTGSIYKTMISLPVNGYNLTLSNNTTLLANQIFKDGVMLFEARWPDIGNVNDLLDKTKTRSITSMMSFGASSLTDNGLPSVSLTGAKIWINGWFMTVTKTISSHTNKTLTYGSITDPKFRKNYYVTGKLGLLSVEKEWHYEGGTLYLWQPGGGSPTNIEYKARNWGFDLTNKSNITIKGLHFFACVPVHGNTASVNTTVDGIVSRYMNHSFLQEGPDVIYYNAKQTGIKLVGENSIIKNSDIQYTSCQAIWLGKNCVADNNIIRDISYDGNYGAAITLFENTPNQKITRNSIYRTGRSAIDFGPTGPHNNVDVSYNDMHTYGMLNVDLGAVYGARGVSLTGTRIHHNWIHDIAVADPLNQDGIQTGLYFDQAAGPTTCDHNVLWNNGVADYYAEIKSHTHNSGGHKLYNNTFASVSPVRHSYVTYVTSPYDVQRNNIYRKNIVVNWTLPGDVANSLKDDIDPLFVGAGEGGLRYRLKPGSPAINKGINIIGITDGSVGTPDIGAYEFGATEWTAGYRPLTTTPTDPIPPDPIPAQKLSGPIVGY